MRRLMFRCMDDNPYPIMGAHKNQLQGKLNTIYSACQVNMSIYSVSDGKFIKLYIWLQYFRWLAFRHFTAEESTGGKPRSLTEIKVVGGICLKLCLSVQDQGGFRAVLLHDKDFLVAMQGQAADCGAGAGYGDVVIPEEGVPEQDTLTGAAQENDGAKAEQDMVLC